MECRRRCATPRCPPAERPPGSPKAGPPYGTAEKVGSNDDDETLSTGDRLQEVDHSEIPAAEAQVESDGGPPVGRRVGTLTPARVGHDVEQDDPDGIGDGVQFDEESGRVMGGRYPAFQDDQFGLERSGLGGQWGEDADAGLERGPFECCRLDPFIGTHAPP